MRIYFCSFVGIMTIFLSCFGLLQPSRSLRVSHASSMNRYRQIYGMRREMSSGSKSDDVDDDSDLNNEVFMELIANQKRVRHNKKSNKIKIQPIGPEFSRIVNIEQVPGILIPHYLY